MHEAAPTALPSRRKALRRRAVVALAWGMGLAVLVQVGLGALVHTQRWWNAIDPDYHHKRAKLLAVLREGGPAPTVVMLGTSRTQLGLRGQEAAQALERSLSQPVRVFNFGHPAAGPVRCLLTYRRLRADGIRPDLLLVEVFPPRLLGGPGGDEVPETILPTSSLLHDEVDLLARYAPAPRSRTAWWKAVLTGAWEYRYGLVQRVAPALVEPQFFAQAPEDRSLLALQVARGERADGWLPCNSGAAAPQRRAKALAQAQKEYENWLPAMDLGGPGCDALRDLLAECRAEGVPAALVLMPEGPLFRSWY